MSFPLLGDLDPNNWDYKAEGFDSLILKWIGPPSSEYHLKVLRLFKNQNEGFRRGNAVPIEDFTSRVKILSKYIDYFISEYLPEIDNGVPVSVTSEFVEAIAKKVQGKRPERRIKESYICTTSKVAIIHDDHIPPNSLVVEIKPKWGFLPDCPLIDADSAKLKVSRFQLMQRYKLKKGEIKQFTKYDPIDLFSLDETRIRKAIDSLVENPQGNLKVFRDMKSSKLEQDEIPKLVTFIHDNPALNQLLKLQKLDVWDIECLPPIIEKAENPTWDQLLSDMNVVEGVKKMISEGYHLPKSHEEAEALRNNLTKEEARIFVAGFCISQAAKDCSIMITFENEDLTHPNVFIIDFDMKMPELLISNYLKSDQQILKAYQETQQ